MVRSWVVERVPRMWALWAASRPSQLALIGLLYVLGVGMTTTGSPLVADGATATAFGDIVAPGFSMRVVTGAVALLPVAVAVHYANEYADADTDALTDRTPFSGGSGALVETGLPVSFLRAATVVASVAAVGVALGGIVIGGLPFDAVCVLLVILVAGLAYSVPPVALVRRGVGEPINAALGGLLLPVYGVAVVATPTAFAALAVVPFTLVVGCNLLAVHWPDRRADEAVGKRTLAVRWAPGRIRLAFATLAILAGIVAIGLWWGGILPDAVALAHLAPVPFLLRGWITLTRRRSPLPAVAAMVALAVSTTVAWWWVGVG
jgi:1,4-dihydroxy-2-naphthoate octaprenyltransferase